MAIFNTTLHCTKEAPADETQEDKAVIIGIVVLASALIGCSLALVALGRDFFIGKNPPVVLVSALVWVDFIGVFSTSVIVFHGLLKGSEWMRDSPQCGLQVYLLFFVLRIFSLRSHFPYILRSAYELIKDLTFRTSGLLKITKARFYLKFVPQKNP